MIRRMRFSDQWPTVPRVILPAAAEAEAAPAIEESMPQSIRELIGGDRRPEQRGSAAFSVDFHRVGGPAGWFVRIGGNAADLKGGTAMCFGVKTFLGTL